MSHVCHNQLLPSHDHLPLSHDPPPSLCRKHVSDGEGRIVEEKVVALRAVCCSALTQLVLNDTNAQLIVQVSPVSPVLNIAYMFFSAQSNGVYLIATNILPPAPPTAAAAAEMKSEKQPDSHLQLNLQRYALRALRYGLVWPAQTGLFFFVFFFQFIST